MRVYAEADGWSPQDGLELIAPPLTGRKRCPERGEQPGWAAPSARGAGVDTVYQCGAVLPGDAWRIHGWDDTMGISADDVWDAPACPAALGSPALSTPKSTAQWPTASHGPFSLLRCHPVQQRTPQDDEQPEFSVSQQEQRLSPASAQSQCPSCCPAKHAACCSSL